MNLIMYISLIDRLNEWNEELFKYVTGSSNNVWFAIVLIGVILFIAFYTINSPGKK